MKLKYGFSYYPEHCNTKDEIAKDLKLIKDSGANVVRMGEFCWDCLEPHEYAYNLKWFEDVVNLFGDNGISTVICTPTACPPAWLVEKHPEIMYVDNRGVTRPFGGRHHFCYNSEIYRKYSEMIVSELGRCFGTNPYVLGFQVGNEFAQESSGRCHCDDCVKKFRNWLEKEYGNINELNKRWGTKFWGQTYNYFNQIMPPIATVEKDSSDLIKNFYDNPSLRLLFERFCSESLTEYLQLQIEILKGFTEKIITTNSTGFGTNSINYFNFYKNLDVYGCDEYPDLAGEDMNYYSFENSFAYNIKKRSFWILEYSIGGGHGLWGKEGGLQPYPGAIEQSVIYSFASGAELLAHFKYKVFCSGAEQLNYALMDQDRVPRRRYFEFQKTAKQIQMFEDILINSYIPKSEIAICIDYDCLWSLLIKPIKKEFNYILYCSELYNILKEIGCRADVISMEDDLNNYKIVILPAAFIMSEKFKDDLKSYVRNGGTVLTTFLAAVKNRDNVAINETLPCGLTELFGIKVNEVEPVFPQSQAEVCITSGDKTYIGYNKYWCETLDICGAQVVAKLNNTYRKGQAVASKNLYGNGEAYYIGTSFDEASIEELFSDIIYEKNIRRVPFGVPEGVEVITRRYAGRDMYFVFNFLKHENEIVLDSNYISFPYNALVGDKITLPPKGYICIRRE